METLVILGGGSAGWMAAAALARALKDSGVRIRLVESDGIAPIGVGEATVPDIRMFNQFVGLEEAAFITRCEATLKLGIEFVDWGSVGRRYMHSFTGSGAAPTGKLFYRLFQRHLLAATARGETASLDDYNLGTVAARAGRVRLGPGAGAAAPALSYAYHFDAALYAALLREHAEAGGVERVAGTVAAVERAADGSVGALRLGDGTCVEGDFFIDCSGFAGLIIGQALGVGYESWAQWLPCDRAIAVAAEPVGPPAAHTRATATSAGWLWRIPLQHRIGHGHVYSSRHLSDDEAHATLLSRIEGRPLREPRLIPFATGKRARVWERNCLALGLAAGFIEPLESTSLHLVQAAIMRLISLFPGRSPDPAEIAEFNRQTDEETLDVRDFVIAHYKLTQRVDTRFWRECRDMEVPERVRHIIALFGARGRLASKPEQLFTAESWLSILYGQSTVPHGFDPLLAPVSDADVARHLDRNRQIIAREAGAMPTHAEVLRSFVAGTVR